MIDLPDGSMILPPNPAQARALRLVVGGSGLFSLVVAIAFIFVTLGNPNISWAVRLVPLALVATGDTFAWFTIRPPLMKADTLEVRCINPIYGTRMARSEVAFVFRGQRFQKSRAGGTWDKSYLFARSDGSVGAWAGSSWFSDEGITEFAGRLGVPVRGDFSARVKDRIE